jgi:hypothetical protein
MPIFDQINNTRRYVLHLQGNTLRNIAPLGIYAFGFLLYTKITLYHLDSTFPSPHGPCGKHCHPSVSPT